MCTCVLPGRGGAHPQSGRGAGGGPPPGARPRPKAGGLAGTLAAMEGIEIRGIRREDVPRAAELLFVAFEDELSGRGTDFARLERLLSLFTCLNRLPLRLLHALGVVAELWVARTEGKVIGVLGQIGRRAPYMSGIAIDPGFRGEGIAQALFERVFSDLAQKGFPFVRGAVLSHNQAALNLCAKTGLLPYARTQLYVLSLPPTQFPNASPGITVRRARRRDLSALWPKETDEEGLRRLLSLEGGYEAWPLRLLGGWNWGLVAEREGQLIGYLGMQANRYQTIGTIRVPLLFDDAAYPPLLRAALEELVRLRRNTAYIDLLDGQGHLAPLLEKIGARADRSWVQLVRRLP